VLYVSSNDAWWFKIKSKKITSTVFVEHICAFHDSKTFEVYLLVCIQTEAIFIWVKWEDKERVSAATHTHALIDSKRAGSPKSS